jgi:hypothetical protein
MGGRDWSVYVQIDASRTERLMISMRGRNQCGSLKADSGRRFRSAVSLDQGSVSKTTCTSCVFNEAEVEMKSWLVLFVKQCATLRKHVR